MKKRHYSVLQLLKNAKTWESVEEIMQEHISKHEKELDDLKSKVNLALRNPWAVEILLKEMNKKLSDCHFKYFPGVKQALHYICEEAAKQAEEEEI